MSDWLRLAFVFLAAVNPAAVERCAEAVPAAARAEAVENLVAVALAAKAVPADGAGRRKVSESISSLRPGDWGHPRRAFFTDELKFT